MLVSENSSHPALKPREGFYPEDAYVSLVNSSFPERKKAAVKKNSERSFVSHARRKETSSGFSTDPLISCGVANVFFAEVNRICDFAFIQGATSLASEERQVEEVLETVYDLEDKFQGKLAARTLMVFLETHLKRRSLSTASILLGKADVPKLGVHSLVGLVRTTARVKEVIPEWTHVYRASYSHVDTMGHSAKRLFVGLPSPGQQSAVLGHSE